MPKSAHKKFLVFLFVCIPLFAAAEDLPLKPMSLAAGFDEGLAAKMVVVDRIYANAAVNYRTIGAQDTTQQAVQSFLLKIGGGYTVLKYKGLAVHGMADWTGTLNQGQTSELTTGNIRLRYNTWDHRFRVGVSPEVFISSNLSLAYKMGLEVLFLGSDFKLNQAKNDLETLENDHEEFGVFGGHGTGDIPLVHHLALYVWF